MGVGAPAMGLLAPAAIVVIVLLTSGPATVLSPAARRATDIALPASVRSEPEIPTLAVRFQTVSAPASAPIVASRPQTGVNAPIAPIAPSHRVAPIAPSNRVAPVAPSHRVAPSDRAAPVPNSHAAPPVRPEPDVTAGNAPVAPVAPSHGAQAPAVVPLPERVQAMATPSSTVNTVNTTVNTVNTIPDEQPAILAAINRYQAAYQNLDATAAKRVWPTVNERELAKAFGELESQTLTFEPCQIDVTGTRARASCPGYARYVGRVGKTSHGQRRDWTFVLQKSNESWLIDAVQAR